MATEHTHEHIPEETYGVLPDEGVVELTDTLTGYMHEIELGGLTDIMGQVLDDFLEQSGGMPRGLKADDALEEITQNQLAVPLAYHLGRLEGRSPQIVQKMMYRQKWSGHVLKNIIDAFVACALANVAQRNLTVQRSPVCRQAAGQFIASNCKAYNAGPCTISEPLRTAHRVCAGTNLHVQSGRCACPRR